MEIIFFAFIFLLGLSQWQNLDLWLHLKSGEIISKYGIIHHDIFSYTAAGREWFPYEWLFQLTIYYVQHWFGLASLRYFSAIFICLMVVIIYKILRTIFNLNRLWSLFVSFYFFVSIFEFLDLRPHIVAYTFLLINLYLIFLYFFKNKNLLWFSLPITILWANLHASIILDVFLFAGFTFISFINLYLFKDVLHRKKWKTFIIFTLLTFILTILPPLGLLQYRLVWVFFKERSLISTFITEWLPLLKLYSVNISSDAVIAFLVSTCLIGIISFVVILKEKTAKENAWIIVLIPFIVLAFFSNRNVFLAYIALTILLGSALSQVQFLNFSFTRRIILHICAFSFLIILLIILYQKRLPGKTYNPFQATQFIKSQNIQGHMFNSVEYGDYFLYQLYPKQKVFIDGRLDVYYCCELKDLYQLFQVRYVNQNQYQKILNSFWNKYDISFVVIDTKKNTHFRKVAETLSLDRNWGLVFWDDYFQIFVRRDGKNDTILRKFSVTAATPYEKTPYRTGLDNEAQFEYERMQKVADSAISRNAIGFILLKKGKFSEAKNQFETAIKLDSTFESPYMNLGELQVREGNYQEAIRLYKKALTLAPQREFIPLRLQQLQMLSR